MECRQRVYDQRLSLGRRSIRRCVDFCAVVGEHPVFIRDLQTESLYLVTRFSEATVPSRILLEAEILPPISSAEVLAGPR